VLRLRTGASIRVFDGQGCEHHAKLTEIIRSGIILEIREPVAVIPESPLELTLLQGIARNDRMDFILQKAVELGVQTIQPIWMQRSHTRLKGERLEKRINHWLGVIINACEQCGRATLPQLLRPEDYLNWINAGTGSELRLMLQPDARACLRNLEKPASSISILVGPEGGLAPEEQTQAMATGFTGIRTGPRVLRTETAALATLAGIQTLWGDFS
jgi:16S rRNA (uracil1498-N3)-methyltransferase